MKKTWEKNKNLPDGYRICTKCNSLKVHADFHKHSGCYLGINSVCKECRKPLSQQLYDNTSLEHRLWSAAKSRAKRNGREFSIAVSDVVIPKLCPVLGEPIVYSSVYAPSIDRVDSSKGYTKDNIRVISKRANMLKNNATVHELESVIKYIRGEI